MRTILTLLMLTVAVFASQAATAFELEESLKVRHTQYQAPAELRIVQSGCTSLSQAIQSVRNRTGGQILSAETRVQGGREVHYIKVLKDGKVKTHKVNGCRR